MTPRTTPDAEPVFELVEQDEIGYETTHVDAFMARAREARDGGAPLTAEEVRQARFATVNGGYATDEVDDELDRLEEELAAAERQAFVAERGDEDWAADLEERARASEKVRNFIVDAEIVKVIVREPKLVNLVIR